MIVVIEGPDGSGKTTLARKIASEFFLDYHHEGPPPGNMGAYEHYCLLLEHVLRRRSTGHSHGAVLDRFALGELVYGPILRGSSRLSEDQLNQIRRFLHDANAIEIACAPSFAVCYHNWSVRRAGELFKEVAVYERTYTRFYEVFNCFNQVQPFRFYDYTAPDAEKNLLHFLRGFATHVVD